MMLTWTPDPVPYDQAFEAIKTAIDALPVGVKLFINSGAFAVDN
jgi:pyridoxine 4-dehydrogenase